MYSDFEYVEYDGKAVVLIRRAASTTIKRSLGNPLQDGKPKVPVHAFIRDPIDRVHSGFKELPGSIVKCPKDMTYLQYVDQILSGEKERHWDSQAEIIAGIENITLYLFESLENIWSDLGFPELKPHNISMPMDNPDRLYRVGELMNFYSDDYELRYGHCR